MKMQVSVIVALVVLSLEIVDVSEGYKGVRPYKYYSPRPWRPLRWHPPAKSPKRYHAKRRPTYKSRPYEPEHHRYAPHYQDSVDVSDDDKPYVIVIQLPRRKEKLKKRPYQRAHVIKPSEHEREIDYIDDDNDNVNNDNYDSYYDSYGDGYDDGEVKVFRLDNNKVHIKVNNRLSVLTS
ncbi:uncharacterized protein LOC116845868 isoform X2 [Odontomachus brunneus]|uniref:uncharacterized protein LOC116845868 isoform X2 n=1 Tax=Odontomachus brunneus TaxID=486640 RepID=UPI0013F1FB98|nr:uncharacterized protein LOC116845868 isoform X2 [Odontomachus brunneus]